MTLDQLLAQLVDNALTPEVAAVQLESIARSHSSQRPILIARVQSDVAAGRLPLATGRILLEAIDRALRDPVGEKTAVLPGGPAADATQVNDDATSMRPGSAATAVHPLDNTQQPTTRPIAKTLVRPAPTESDETSVRTPGEATLQGVAPTLRIDPRPDTVPPTEVAAHDTVAGDPDATLQT
ncbi:MAG TPA: hypothetical protein VIT67_13880, partial [Povalibacter sp.]